MPGRRLEVVHVGSAWRDIAPDDPRGWRLGGGVTYAALTTARLGSADRGAHRRRRGGARRARARSPARRRRRWSRILDVADAPVFHNRETPSGRRPDLPRARHAARRSWTSRRRGATPGPGRSRRSPARSATTGRPSIPDGAFVAVGWQGFLRDLVAGERVDAPAAGPDRRCSRGPTSSGSATRRRPDDVARRPDAVAQARRGPARDAWQTPAGCSSGRGRRAGQDASATCRPAPTRSTRPAPGDTFLAALAASALRPAIAGRHRSRRPLDLRFAAAAGSLAVEAVGLDGVPDRAAVNVRALASGSGGRCSRPEPQVGDYREAGSTR